MRLFMNSNCEMTMKHTEIKSPAPLSRPFTPTEFLSWLSWHETNGDVSLGEIRCEAESMLRHAGLIK